MPEASRIVAVLGPTNTGKTHRAIERMLEHDSGVLGLPLRLLAREVYDRVSARIGRDGVALVTGEEKIVPPRPRYTIATVEAMPLQRDVAFVGVDEIQLVAHRERGHVFTDRLLHARGTRETWFLGSDAIKPLLSMLVPTAQIEGHPRLSRLSFTGAEKLTRVPGRSAVVAFSMDKVYEVAERLRALRGGAAVVLGALSPRTRNAQVAMFQAGEVDTLVATDAIGMGLNLDVAHVAFIARHKFDGRELRELEDAEVAQIAGRAGRYLTDGTFGTVAPLELPHGTVVAVEGHRFPAIRKARYRPHLLDFSSANALLASLRAPPTRPGLVSVEGADDQAAFERLVAMPEIRARLRGETEVALLWEVASVPDFRKLLFEAYVDDLREIFVELCDHGRLSSAFMERAIEPLGANMPAHDVEVLLGRMTALRTWAYVAHKSSWVDDAVRFRDETRVLEERLSDSLHVALTARFVTEPSKRPRGARGSRAKAPTREVHAANVDDGRAPVRAGHPFAKLAEVVLPGAPRVVGLETREEDRFESLVDAAHERFVLEPDGTITADGVPLARLSNGPRVFLPGIRMSDVSMRPGVRARLERRLLAFARDSASRLLAPMGPIRMSDVPALRGIAHLLDEGLGTVRATEARSLVAALGTPERALLDTSGVVLGGVSVYAPALVRAQAIGLRATLLRASGKRPPTIARGATSILRKGEEQTLVALGFVPLGPRAVRADVAERALNAALGGEDVSRIATWIGSGTHDTAHVVRALLSAARDASTRPAESTEGSDHGLSSPSALPKQKEGGES